MLDLTDAQASEWIRSLQQDEDLSEGLTPEKNRGHMKRRHSGVHILLAMTAVAVYVG